MGNPLVGILMGSESDLGVMRAAAEVLAELKVEHEMTVLSAHRTPRQAAEYFGGASGRGIKVLICGAGAAAHLAGAAAAHSHLPIIGVPILGPAMSGLDSLLSTVQMPAGLPVATVAVNGARNAGILAAQVLATADPALAQRVQELRKKGEAKVLAVAERWRQQGPPAA